MGFLERMEVALNKGLATTKEILEKARDKTKELGEKGSLKFQVMQLENQAQKRLAKLGSKVYELLVKEERKTVSKQTAGIREILEEIGDIEEKIAKSEAKMKEMGE